MTRRISYTVLFITFFFLSFYSCVEIEDLPDEPKVEFRSFEIFDTLDILGNQIKGGRLKFYFEDGDGDLGLKEPSGIFADSTNLFLTLLRKVNGSYVPAPANDPLEPSDYRIPWLGMNKVLKGTVSVTFLYLFFEPSDTIKYEFFIRDRARHDSNKDETCEIAVNRNGICIPG